MGMRFAGRMVFPYFSKLGGRKSMMVENRGSGAGFLSAGGTPCYSCRSHHLVVTKCPQLWLSQSDSCP